MKWTRNVRIEGCRRAGARPQELRLPRAWEQARRMEPLLGSEPEESVAMVWIAHPSPRLSTVSAVLEDSPAESRNQETAERTKRTQQSASDIRIHGGFECNWLYPWRGRTIVVSFSHVSTERSTSVTPVCSVMKWPMGQVKCLRTKAKSSESLPQF